MRASDAGLRCGPRVGRMRASGVGLGLGFRVFRLESRVNRGYLGSITRPASDQNGARIAALYGARIAPLPFSHAYACSIVVI